MVCLVLFFFFAFDVQCKIYQLLSPFPCIPCLDQDNGPQLPTNVIAMLRYGINLLQVVGQFNGTS